VRFAEALEAWARGSSGAVISLRFAVPLRANCMPSNLDLNHIPDAAMTLAVAALFADGPCRLRNIASWRVKETDRIAAMATELRKLGATVEEGADYIAVTLPAKRNSNYARASQRRLSTRAQPSIPMTIIAWHVLFTGRAWGRADDHQRPELREQDLPGLFRCLCRNRRTGDCIDGPSASGKGTVPSGWPRSLAITTWIAVACIVWPRCRRCARMSRSTTKRAWRSLPKCSRPASRPGGILLDGDDVTEAIRTEEISAGASKVAALPAVRAALLARQRAYRRFPGLVADGRDMGSVVFPGAAAKIFLTASAEARAERRFKQLIAKGMPANMHALLHDLQERDAAMRSAAQRPFGNAAMPRLWTPHCLTSMPRWPPRSR